MVWIEIRHFVWPDLGINFAKVISRQQKLPLAGKELYVTLSRPAETYF